MTDPVQVTHDMKVCPRCAEDIRAEAIVCRYCGADLAPDQSSEVPGPAVVRPETPPATEPAVAPIGRTRAGIVPKGIQRVGYWLMVSSAALFTVFLAVGVIGVGIAAQSRNASPFLYWYRHPFGLGIEYGGPPIFLFLLWLPVVLFQPKLLKPRAGSLKARWAAQRTYFSEFKKRFGERPLKLSRLKAMIIGALVTWIVILVGCAAFVAKWSDEVRTDIGKLPYIAFVLAAMGIVGAVLTWPTSRSQVIHMEDDGTVHI